MMSSRGQWWSVLDLLCNALNKNFLIFLTENLPILNPYLPPKSENLRPHSSKSIENATLSSGTSLLASCKGVSPPPGRSFILSWCSLPFRLPFLGSLFQAFNIVECGAICAAQCAARIFRFVPQGNTSQYRRERPGLAVSWWLQWRGYQASGHLLLTETLMTFTGKSSHRQRRRKLSPLSQDEKT